MATRAEHNARITTPCATCASRQVVDCPDCGRRGIARCACFADVKCVAHANGATR